MHFTNELSILGALHQIWIYRALSTGISCSIEITNEPNYHVVKPAHNFTKHPGCVIRANVYAYLR